MKVTQEQHDFISSMTDKYDYRSYMKFCIDNGFEVTSFQLFAFLVEKPDNQPPRFIPNATSVIAEKNSCCGGGSVK